MARDSNTYAAAIGNAEKLPPLELTNVTCDYIMCFKLLKSLNGFHNEKSTELQLTVTLIPAVLAYC